VKAPNDPPPCSARDTCLFLATALRLAGWGMDLDLVVEREEGKVIVGRELHATSLCSAPCRCRASTGMHRDCSENPVQGRSVLPEALAEQPSEMSSPQALSDVPHRP
jgi:hypothetical protein